MTNLSSTTVTEGIQVEAIPQYVPENSNPQQNEYLFSYQITITNNSEKTIKLLSRNWMVIDGNGVKEEISGAGVVGQTSYYWSPKRAFNIRAFAH